MNTVTNFGWSVSSTSGSGIKGAILHISKRRNGLEQRGELDGVRYPSSDAAHQAAKDHGYTVEHFSRPACFINLRLSRATRKFLATKTESERWAWVVLNVLEESDRTCQYKRAVASAGYMSNTRSKWQAYLRGENPERRNR